MCLDMQKWMQNMQEVHNGQMTLLELKNNKHIFLMDPQKIEAPVTKTTLA